MRATLLSDKVFRIGLIVAFMPFLFISIYNFPAGLDDYNNALVVLENGEWGSVEYFYKKWTGRYTLTILLAYFNPIKYGYWFTGMKIAPVVIFALFLLSITYCFKSILREQKDLTGIFFGSLSFLLLYLFSVPAVADLFYWFSGACTYTSGLIFFMLSTGGVVNFGSADNKSKKLVSIVISVVFLILAIGTNESILMGIIFISFIALVYSYHLKSELTKALFLLFVVAVVFSLISILAPGNFIRSGGMHGGESVLTLPKLVKAAMHSIYYTFVNMVGWMTNFVLILYSVVFIPIAFSLINKFGWIRKGIGLNPALSWVISVLFLSVQAFPSYLGMSDVDPRVWSSIYFFFLIIWFFNVLVLVNYIKVGAFNVNFVYVAKCLIIFLLIFSGQGNVNQATFDLFLRAPSYSASLNERYDLILKSENKHLVVSPVFERTYKYPNTIYSSDITTNTENYSNTSLSKYFNLKSIKINKEPIR